MCFVPPLELGNIFSLRRNAGEMLDIYVLDNMLMRAKD